MTRSSCTVVLAAIAAIISSGCHSRPAFTPPVITLLPPPGTAHPTYAITDLGLGEAHALNNKGQIIGFFHADNSPKIEDAPFMQWFLWDKGKRIVMETSNGWWTRADVITNQGQILGKASVPGHTSNGWRIEHNCRWQDGKTTDLEADPRFRGIRLMHLTKSGTLYAVSEPQGALKQQHLWFYPAGFGPGSRDDLGIIGDGNVYVTAINDTGQIVGEAGASPVYRAFLWQKGRLTNLGTLGGSNSKATDLNNAGQIVGIADLAQKPTDSEAPKHAFLWERGKMHDLGALPGCDTSYPSAINSKGEIAGSSRNQHSPSQPVLWKQGQIITLSNLVPRGTQWQELLAAESINKRGQVVGYGLSKSDQHLHGFLLTPLASTRQAWESGYKASEETNP